MLILFLLFFLIANNPSISQAKSGDEQAEIILLNDSAAAVEDTDPVLSKNLTQFAEEREKAWEYDNAHKDALPIPVTEDKNKNMRGQVKLLNAAVIAIEPTYPLIAKGLQKMIKEMDEVVKNEK